MKKTLALLGIAALFAGQAMAATEVVDLSGSGTVEEKTYALGATLTAANVNTWLTGTTGWKITTQGGRATFSSNPANFYEASGTTGVSVNFVSLTHEGNDYLGYNDTTAYIGCAYTLSNDIDLSDVKSLTLKYEAEANVSYDGSTYNDAVDYDVYLVYKNGTEWTAVSGTAINRGGEGSLTVTPTDLASGTFYIVANADATSWGISNMDFTMTANVVPTTEAVPEPATATLSLLALAGLAARRRRK